GGGRRHGGIAHVRRPGSPTLRSDPYRREDVRGPGIDDQGFHRRLDLEREALTGTLQRIGDARFQRDPGDLRRELEQTASNVGRRVRLRQEVSDAREDPERSRRLLDDVTRVDRLAQFLRIRRERRNLEDREPSRSISLEPGGWKRWPSRSDPSRSICG